MRELTFNEIEVVSGAGNDNWYGVMAATFGMGAAAVAPYALVPGPHVPFVAALTATFSLGAAGFGLWAAFY